MDSETLNNVCLSSPELWRIFSPHLMQKCVLKVDDVQKWRTKTLTSTLKASGIYHMHLHIPDFGSFNSLFSFLNQNLQSLTLQFNASVLDSVAFGQLFSAINALPNIETLRFFVYNGEIGVEVENSFCNKTIKTLAMNFDKLPQHVLKAIITKFSSLKYFEISSPSEISAILQSFNTLTKDKNCVIRHLFSESGSEIYELLSANGQRN